MSDNRTEMDPASRGGPAEHRRSGWRRARSLLLQGGPLIALLLLGLYLAFATPYFLTEGNLTNVARRTSVIALLAIGQTFVILAAGIDLSVGSITALAGSTAAVAMTRPITLGGSTLGPVDFLPGLLVALAVGMLAGLINGLIITKGKIPDFIATLGTLSAYRGIALLVTGGLPVPSFSTAEGARNELPPQLIWLGSGDVLGFPAAALVALLVAVAGWLILQYTALGRSIYAVGGNREAARVSGINVDRTRIAVYTVSGICAGLGGFLLAGRLSSANALMGTGLELESIAAVVIGGTNLFGGEGGVFGSLIGSLITGVLNNGLNLLNVSSFWQQIVQGLVIIVVVIFDQWRRRRFRAVA